MVQQIAGHSYIDIEALAEITNGMVTIEGNRILLTLPETPAASAPVPAAPAGAIPLLPGLEGFRGRSGCRAGGDERVARRGWNDDHVWIGCQRGVVPRLQR